VLFQQAICICNTRTSRTMTSKLQRTQMERNYTPLMYIFLLFFTH